MRSESWVFNAQKYLNFWLKKSIFLALVNTRNIGHLSERLAYRKKLGVRGKRAKVVLTPASSKQSSYEEFVI